MTQIKNIGVFTSGGDAPGMNAAIRAVVRAAMYYGIEVTGIRRGYDGMGKGDFFTMNRKSVSNIIQRGGTILKTARCDEFRTPEGRKAAYEHLVKNKVDALVAIGGDGTFTGAKVFGSEYDIPVVGLPGTIDNDLVGTDFTIGYDTAINTVVDAVDKIRDTAESHDRLFIVEVMGRDSGLIALRTGIATGAEAILIPESKTGLEGLLNRLEFGRKDKTSRIVIVAEGEDAGGAFEVGRLVQEKFPNYDTRISILGHIQRGGAPSCMDRVLASRVGAAAVEALRDGHRNEMIGLINGEIAYTPFEHAIKHHQGIDPNMIKLVEMLSM
ncbi:MULTISPECIES: 6-phosphofructokinase [Mucilaginibacter]|jgi:6-phosphofructokinase 1|uniref:ATP-dependent 6-phosphofructokinase n=1 Tax=Mucilaginibacter gossypii TaxID=551996 RepID=A0A1G7XJY0_9SPHI|nr:MULTISPECIES: 6-phosphofructokinase [Mucilaginibacter]NVM64343.1 6-phosphofructokinase 1 [Mucilaginibacter sp. SG538B]QTE35173.1 6-phosphofructokinase [Mucilaginibacter gossypii]RAV58201.1 6-phosphofructokinase [Mucilaginibacter rubeus]WDZ99108.1 6-phosphofructokinase [Mucilaginibacter sp. SJ]WPU99332.1 6-phosphofructokinase [Mucilaginibacter gossypii]